MIETLPGGSLLLGAFPGAIYEESEAFLNPGDLVFLYTDGLSEAMNPAAELFGEERITLLLRDAYDHHPDRLLRLALERVRDFTRGAEQSDDITLLAILRETPTAEHS
jgi:sigma-B regulation protein RsbU (phosphoserine phosphatase)